MGVDMKKTIWLLVLGGILWLSLVIYWASTCYASGKKTYGDVEAIVVEVHDGDTLKVRVDSWPPIIGDGIGVRVYGVDCRELKSGSLIAKDSVKRWIPEGSKVWLSGLRRDKYFRILASVGYNCVTDVDMPEEQTCTDLATELLSNKLAVPYFGEAKKVFPETIK
jgi:endonuclease YncB( thermonuclease family)